MFNKEPYIYDVDMVGGWGEGVLKFASCFLILSTLKELQNYNRKLFLCPAQKLDGKKTNILNWYFSK